MPDIQEKAASFRYDFFNIENEIQTEIIGQKNIIRNIVVSMIAGGNVLLEGLPGLGKTLMVRAISKVLDLGFSRIQFTPDLMPADITGTVIYNKKQDGSGDFEFQAGPVFSNIILADEINRATPKTQSALLEAMQEKTVTVGTKTYKLPLPFFVIATQNPLDMEGAFPLPEAQMDRFMFKLIVDFPNQDELLEILELTTGLSAKEPKSLFGAEKLLEMNETAKAVMISKQVSLYAAQLVLKTHPENDAAADIVKQYVRYGASPRAAQALILGGKIYALLDGRYNVAYDDIKCLVSDVLRHRIFLNFEALSDGISVEDIISDLVV